MAKVVTLYIDDTSLRLLVAKGKQVGKWADLPLEPGLVKDGVVVDEVKVAAKIKQALKDQKVTAKKVIAGLSGLRCVSRPITLPQLPKAMLAEAIRREAARVMPLPLEQLYLLWQILPVPGEQIQVFLVGLSRSAADAMIKTLRRAGLDPYIMDIKPLALARVVNEATAIIVDVGSTELDIVIMTDGVPQLRTLALPSEALSLSQKLPTIKEELDRTIKFYNSSQPEKPLDPGTSIFVSGELAQDSEACQSLASELGHPVLPLSSPLQCPEGLVPSRYMGNIGLALKKVSLPRAKANFSVVDFNALPEVYRPKALPLTKVLIVPAIIIAIGLFGYLAMLVQSTAADTALLQAQLDTTSQLVMQKHAEQQSQKKEIAGLEGKVAELGVTYKSFSTVLNNFGRQREIVNGDLKVTTSTLVSNVDLTGITHASAELTISGMSPSESGILAYARNLRKSGRFSQVSVSSIEKTEDGLIFELSLSARE